MINSSTLESPTGFTIHLPVPTDEGGTSVFAAFEQRRTIREISEKPIPMQLLSNLLWSAWGINRKNGPFGSFGRTAASASNSQEIDLYVATQERTYLYDAANNSLEPKAFGDLRFCALTPGQRGVKANAPLQLIYVVDIHRLTNTTGFQEPGLHDPEVQKSYYYVDTGLIAGNVQLFAAAHGLAAWFHNCDRTNLAQKLDLAKDQRVLFAQSVGYPEKTNERE